MSVNSVSNYSYAGYSAVKESSASAEETKVNAAAEETEKSSASAKEDSLVISADKETIEAEKVAAAKLDARRNVSAFRAMSEALFKAQGNNYNGKLKTELQDIIGKFEFDAEDTSFDDDPEWGVDAVAGRILDFAKSLAGGDPSKIDMLRDAVKKGFEAAGAAWGDELPGISKRTYEKVMQGFDDWEREFETAAAEEEE